mgnify:CR=1 FL=1
MSRGATALVEQQDVERIADLLKAILVTLRQIESMLKAVTGKS